MKMGHASRQRLRGFTLIELIVVMMLLATVLALSLPRLGRFMSGRDINEETRRLLALTRYARSEAINRSERMEIWFDPQAGAYGLRPESVPEQNQAKPIEFHLAEKLGLELDAEARNDQGESVILFWPDGSIDETSPDRITLTEDGEPRFVIALTANRLEFVAEDALDAQP